MTHHPDTPISLLTDFRLRVCYADTDAAGVMHHARFLEFFERSRTEWLTRRGAGHDLLEKERGHVLVIRETTLTFHQPGRLNDQLIFSHEVTHKGRSQLTLVQKAYRLEAARSITDLSTTALLVTGTFHLVCFDLQQMKSTPLPDVF